MSKILIPSTTTHTRDLAFAAARRGYDVAVVTFRRAEKNERLRGTRVTVLDGVWFEESDLSLRGASPELPFGLSAPALAAARETLQRHKPDIVHASGWSATFAQACYELNIPCVSSVHHWGLVCPDGTLFDWEGKACERPVERETCASCCRRSLTGGALVDALVKLAPPETIRWADSFFAAHKVPLLTGAVRMTTGPDRLMHTIRALSLPGNLVVAPSRAAADALLRNGVPVSQVGVLPFGITPFGRSPLQPELGRRPVRFLFAGRIEHVKGLHILLHALAHMPRSRKWELDIVGEAVTSEGTRYRRWLRDEELDWSRVTWRGQVEHERIGELLAACDVLVAPSIGLELYPLVIQEAFSVGRPVIAARSGASGEMVRDGVDGILVEPRNVGQLEEALGSLIENPERIGEMAANIGAVQTMDEYLADLETIYADAIRLRQPCGT